MPLLSVFSGFLYAPQHATTNNNGWTISKFAPELAEEYKPLLQQPARTMETAV
jgi:hypothetical protein